MPEDLPHHVRGDLPQVADQAEMALAELRWMVGRGVAGLDRHRDHARAGAPRGRDQHLRFEHEALAGYVVERIHRAWIQALAALAVDKAETAAPGDAPVAEIIDDAAVDRRRGALAQPSDVEHAERAARLRLEQQTRVRAAASLAARPTSPTP